MNKLFNRILSVLCLTLVFFLPSQWAFADEIPKHLRFLSGPPGGNWFALGTALSDMWTKNVLQTTSSTGGGVSNIINVNNGRADLGFTVASFISAAIHDEADFKGRNIDNAVLFANLYKQVMYTVVREDFAKKHNVSTLGEIIEKKIPVRFATLKPGTASEFLIRIVLENGYHTNYAELRKNNWSIQYASYDGGADLIADNHIDVFVFSVGVIAPIIMNIESRVPIQLLGIEQEALDLVAQTYGTTTYTIEPDAYACVKNSIKTVGDYTSIVIRKDLPDQLVYDLSKSMWDKKAELVNAVGDVKELEPGVAVPDTIPVHEGAKQFWNTVQ